jgi:hypothetical protein
VPLDFLVEDSEIRANALLTNAQQNYAQVEIIYSIYLYYPFPLFIEYLDVKLKNTLLFKPWRGMTLENGFTRLEEITQLIRHKQFDVAIESTSAFIKDCLKSLTYYQTYEISPLLLLIHRYDRTLLLLVTSLNYLVWLSSRLSIVYLKGLDYQHFHPNIAKF